jgi:hypothetical protein
MNTILGGALSVISALKSSIFGKRHMPSIPYFASIAYGPNPQQTLRAFRATAGPTQAPWVLVYLNSGYLKNNQFDTVNDTSEPLYSMLQAGFTLVIGTVTYPGQPGIPGLGRFLPPTDPKFTNGDRVERDAFAAWNKAIETAPAWGLDPQRGGVFGRSGGTHPALLAAHSNWAVVTHRPKFCIVIGAHTWWPAWVQDGGVPAYHFYHVSDTGATGLPNAYTLSQTAMQHQIRSSFCDYVGNTYVPTLWYASDPTVDVESLYPIPSGTLTMPHSPWFSCRGYDRLRGLSPSTRQMLMLHPDVAVKAIEWGLPAEPTLPEDATGMMVSWASRLV